MLSYLFYWTDYFPRSCDTYAESAEHHLLIDTSLAIYYYNYCYCYCYYYYYYCCYDSTEYLNRLPNEAITGRKCFKVIE